MRPKQLLTTTVVVLSAHCFAQQVSTVQTSTPTISNIAQAVRSLYNESLKFQESGNLDASLSKAEQALSLVPANDVSENRPALLSHIGTIHDSAKRFEQATPFHQQALELEEKRIGLNNHKLDAYLYYVAGNHIDRANYSDAEKAYLRIVQIMQSKRGHRPYELDEPLRALANLYDLQGKLDDTERVVRTLVEIASKPTVIFGVTFNTSASAWQNLGAVMVRRGNLKEAIRLHLSAQARIDERVEEDQKSSIGAGSGSLLQSIENLERLTRLHQLSNDESQAKQSNEKAQTLRARLPAELFNLNRPLSWRQSVLLLEAASK
jgi:tetratricopeptide (TPR) repeat protein